MDFRAFDVTILSSPRTQYMGQQVS